jgi:hypothetical protein
VEIFFEAGAASPLQLSIPHARNFVLCLSIVYHSNPKVLNRNQILSSNLVRWPEPNAGWRDGTSVEAYLALDLFVSFCIKAKRKETRQKANATEALRSASGANRKKLVSDI